MKKTPAIAQRRHHEATANFDHKLVALEKLLNDGMLERFPKRASVLSFATWKDVGLGVQSLSRSIIYDKSDEYLALRKRMDHLLNLVEKARAKTSRRDNVEAELRRKLGLAEERAQDYVNQYSMAMAELSEARKEIERLNNRIRRRLASDAGVIPISNAKTKPHQIE